MMPNITCTLIEVINNTLATCDYKACSVACMNYLLAVVNECPKVFNNETYTQLWLTLFNLCSK